VMFKASVAEALLSNLDGARAIFMSDRAVGLEPFSAVELAAAQASSDAQKTLSDQSAASWVKRKLSEGNVVFATLSLVVPGPGDKQLAAVPKKEVETVKMTSHLAPILIEPSLLSALQTPAGIAVAAVVGGGVLYLLFKKKRRGRSPAARS